MLRYHAHGPNIKNTHSPGIKSTGNDLLARVISNGTRVLSWCREVRQLQQCKVALVTFKLCKFQWLTPVKAHVIGEKHDALYKMGKPSTVRLDSDQLQTNIVVLHSTACVGNVILIRRQV